MSDERDGGPAFPKTIANEDYDKIEATKGMSLRDYFAAQALVGLLAMNANPKSVGLQPEDELLLPRDAYKFADAMLAARNAKKYSPV